MKTQRLFTYLCALLIGLFLAACTPEDTGQETATPQPTATEPSISETAVPDPSETAVPSPTEPPQPTDISGHTWQAQPVLISMQDSPGFTDPSFAWGIGPDLIVYADGRVIYSTWASTGSERGPAYWQAQLPAVDLCNLLIQIDQSGFFDLSPDDYTVPDITDAETTTIAVNSWRSKTFSAYSLAYAINSTGDDGVVVPPGLAETFRLLSSLHPDDAVLYEPASVSLLVSPVDYDIPAQLWPLEVPKLNDLGGDLDFFEDAEFVFEGQTAADLSALFNGSLTKYFEDEGKLFAVTLRPLFPHEIYREATGWGRLSEFEPTPTTEMTCPTE